MADAPSAPDPRPGVNIPLRGGSTFTGFAVPPARNRALSWRRYTGIRQAIRLAGKHSFLSERAARGALLNEGQSYPALCCVVRDFTEETP